MPQPSRRGATRSLAPSEGVELEEVGDDGGGRVADFVGEAHGLDEGQGQFFVGGEFEEVDEDDEAEGDEYGSAEDHADHQQLAEGGLGEQVAQAELPERLGGVPEVVEEAPEVVGAAESG